MPAYDICVRCIDCGAEHPLLAKIFLANGPEGTKSIAEWFDGRSVPPQVSALKHHSALCLKTGKKFTLEEEEDKVFLVPLGPSGRSPTYDCRQRLKTI